MTSAPNMLANPIIWPLAEIVSMPLDCVTEMESLPVVPSIRSSVYPIIETMLSEIGPPLGGGAATDALVVAFSAVLDDSPLLFQEETSYQYDVLALTPV